MFANTPQGFMRVSTSLKNKDGTRLLGTVLPANAPQTTALLAGKRYVGRAKVLGEPFLTVYDPILKDGKVIGAFYIGQKDQSENSIKEYLKKQNLLQTGYFYVLDSDAKFVLHPTKEGENSLALKDLDGRLIFKDMIEMKSVQIEYHWLNAETNQPQKK